MSEINFKEYSSRVRQSFTKDFFEAGSIGPSKEELLLNSKTVLQLLQEHIQKKEYRDLACLTEVLRGNGFFYFDPIEEFGQILALILSQAIALFNSDEVFKDAAVLWLPRGIYDIIFHQIDLKEYPENCSRLYFELTDILLELRFSILYELERSDSEHDSYCQCLYFIDMADMWFSKREHEFLILWRKIEAQIISGKGYAWAEENWPKTFRSI